MGDVGGSVSRHFRPFSSSSPGLSEVESVNAVLSTARWGGNVHTLCLIMINFAIQAGGPLSRTGFPVQKKEARSSDRGQTRVGEATTYVAKPA